jgi:hypothetical protein
MKFMYFEKAFTSQRQRWLILFLLIFGFFLFIYKVGDRDFWAPDEGDYAQVSREMVEQGHWIFPTLNQESYVIKPVLYNWLTALISLPAGDVDEFRARIVSASAALGIILVIFYLGKMMFSVRAGFLASLILGTSALFLQYARWTQINMLSTFLFTITIFLFYQGYTTPEKRKLSYLFMYFTTGIGMLNMGPVDAIMPALVIGVYLLVMKDLKHLKELRLGWGIPIVLAITVPWYLVVSLQGEYALGLLIKTNFTRYFDTWVHKQPFYYYLVNLPGDFIPWTVFLPGAFYLAFSQRSKGERKQLLFLLIWIVSIFLFFSFSQCKRPQYILPIYPALALLTAYLGDQSIQYWNERYFQKWTKIPALILVYLLALGAVVLPLFSWFFQRIWFPISLGIGIICGVFAVLLFIALKKKEPLFLFCLPAFLSLALTLYGVHFLIPRMEAVKSPRSISERIVSELGKSGQWAMYGFFRPVYVYYTHRFAKELRGEEELKNFLEQNSPSLVIMQIQSYKKIKDSLGIKTYVLFRHKVGHRDLVLISNQDNAKGKIGESLS